MDAIDRAILARLASDARLPVAQLATDVGVSRATAYKRVDALVDSGVIQGFAAIVDDAAIGLGVTALLMASVDQNDWREAREAIRHLSCVKYAALVTGDRDLLMLVQAADIESLRDVVLQEVNGIPSVRATRTLLVLEELVDRVNPPAERILGDSDRS